MMRHIVDKGLHKTDFIKKRMENFEALKKFLQTWPVEKAAKETGIDEAVIREVAEIYAKAENAAIVYCMGITQHACGAANVIAVCDLAMLCGHVGKPFSGIYPLRGQNNVQGACDMGALPNLYPGYQAVADPAVREKFQKAWETELSDKPGRTVTELISAAGKDIRALYIMAENPCISDPDVNHVMEALQRLDFLIVAGHLPYGDGEVRPPGVSRRLLCRKDGDVHEHGASLPASAKGRRPARQGHGRLRDPLPDGQGPGARLRLRLAS